MFYFYNLHVKGGLEKVPSSGSSLRSVVLLQGVHQEVDCIGLRRLFHVHEQRVVVMSPPAAAIAVARRRCAARTHTDVRRVMPELERAHVANDALKSVHSAFGDSRSMDFCCVLRFS